MKCAQIADYWMSFSLDLGCRCRCVSQPPFCSCVEESRQLGHRRKYPHIPRELWWRGRKRVVFSLLEVQQTFPFGSSVSHICQQLFFFFFKLSLLMLGRIMLWLLLINVPLSQWSSRYRKVNQTSCSCCLSCWQFCGSTLCRNGSTGQGRRVICTNRKLSDLELKLENWLKYCLNIFWIHVPSCCGYLLFPCSGWLVPQVEICICNFKAASAQKNFLLLRSVQK